MSADRNDSKASGRGARSALNDILDFGPDAAPITSSQESSSFTDRIKQIVKKLQELNKRIDDLATRE